MSSLDRPFFALNRSAGSWHATLLLQSSQRAQCGQLVAHSTYRFWVSAFLPCAPPSSGGWSGGCRRGLMKQLAIRLSWQTTPAKSLVMFEHVDAQRIVRVPQPPDRPSNAGNRAAAANRGRLLWVTFLGKTRKVTCCRATPSGFGFGFGFGFDFDFDCWVSLRSTQPTPEYWIPAFAGMTR